VVLSGGGDIACVGMGGDGNGGSALVGELGGLKNGPDPSEPLE